MHGFWFTEYKIKSFAPAPSGWLAWTAGTVEKPEVYWDRIAGLATIETPDGDAVVPMAIHPTMGWQLIDPRILPDFLTITTDSNFLRANKDAHDALESWLLWMKGKNVIEGCQCRSHDSHLCSMLERCSPFAKSDCRCRCHDVALGRPVK